MYFPTTEQAFALSFQFVIQKLLIKFKCFMPYDERRAMSVVYRLTIKWMKQFCNQAREDFHSKSFLIGYNNKLFVFEF